MINVGPQGFNPQSLPPVRREWGGGVSSHGPGSGAPPTAPRYQTATSHPGGFLPLGGQVDSSGPGRGNLPPMGPMGGGGMQSMMRPPMGGGFGGGYGGGQGMVQGPSFMQQPQQQQRKRVGGAGGVVDPNFRRMMEFKASGGMGNPATQGLQNRQHGPGAFGVSPSLYYQHLDQQGMPVQRQQPQQNMGMGDPMQMMMQMMPFWQMYSQMLGNRGQQGY